MTIREPTIQRIFALVIALLLTRFFIIAPAYEAWTNYWLVKDGREGVAVVTKFLWTGHDVVAYKYRVNQNEYTGQDFRSWQNPQYAHVMVGGQTIIFFSVSHPWLSLINPPRTAMVEGLPVLVLVWFFNSHAAHRSYKSQKQVGSQHRNCELKAFSLSSYFSYEAPCLKAILTRMNTEKTPHARKH